MEYNMKQEDKDILLKDLCARLPYGVKVNADFIDSNRIGVVRGILNEELTLLPETGYPFERNIEYVKPYLFPLTEEILDKATEESNTLYKELICSDSDLYKENNKSNTLLLQAKIRSSVIKYFIIHHIDYNNLIGKGLAIDATGLNIY